MATTMAVLTAWCGACGAEFEATRAEILSGRWKDGCPCCPPAADDPDADEAPADDPGMVADAG